MAPVKPRGKAPARRKAAAPAWSVYLLACRDGTLYAGATSDIERRLVAHGRGAVKYTRGRLPVELAWLEVVGERGAALSREARIKRLSRRDKLALVASFRARRRADARG